MEYPKKVKYQRSHLIISNTENQNVQDTLTIYIYCQLIMLHGNQQEIRIVKPISIQQKEENMYMIH